VSTECTYVRESNLHKDTDTLHGSFSSDAEFRLQRFCKSPGFSTQLASFGVSSTLGKRVCAFKQHFDKITFCNNQHFGDVLDIVVLRISLRFVGVASRDRTHSALYIDLTRISLIINSQFRLIFQVFFRDSTCCSWEC
jgi:hypothetical protein